MFPNRIFTRLIIFILFCLLGLSSISRAQQCQIEDPLKYNIVHYTLKDGLSSNTIYGIYQDKIGYMWFGTTAGLNRFDGYEFRNYNYDPTDSLSLTSGYVWSILEDRYNNFWVATSNGLNLFNRYKDTFAHFFHNSLDSQSLSSSYIRIMFEDHLGNLWLGTEANGLNLLQRETMTFIRYLPGKSVLSLCEVQNEMWVGTRTGLYKWDPNSDKFIRPVLAQKFPELNILQICSMVANVKTIWLGTWKKGYFIVDLNKAQIIAMSLGGASNGLFHDQQTSETWASIRRELYRHPAADSVRERIEFHINNGASLFRSQVLRITKDNAGSMWICTDGDGIYQLNKLQSGFKTLLVSNIKDGFGYKVEPVFCDKNDFWFGTRSQGIYRISKDYKTIRRQPFEPVAKRYYLPITSFCLRKNGEIWLGADGHGGLFHYLRQFDIFESFFNESEIANTLSSDAVNALIEDKAGRLWIGRNTHGLDLFDDDTKTFINFKHEPDRKNSLSSNRISAIAEADSGKLWVATLGGGLNLFNPNDNSAVHFKYIPGIKNCLSENRIYSLHVSNDSILWIGTSVGGLNKFNTVSRTFKHFLMKDGLPSNQIFSIISDNNGDIWIATAKGLSRLNSESEKIRTYDNNDGIINMEFFGFSRSQDGKLFIGHMNGFTTIIPDSLEDNPFIPPIVLTKFHILNLSTKLDTVISEKKHVVLTHNQNEFSFEFAALNFIASQKNKYRYKMDGFDQDWIESGTRRFVSYTNLAPGDYTFRVLGSNNDEVWNETGTSLKITILPPWWKTNLAYSIYIIVILILVYIIWSFQINRLKIKHQLQMEHFEAEKLREVDQLKSQFFANISHEFRTPLTLILGPVKQMLAKKFIGNITDQYQMIIRNGERLLGLINQILDISKLESGEMKLQVSETDITAYLKGLILSFAPLAERKKIKLKLDSETIRGFVDHDKLEKIVTNLLSNAFKFTPEGGEVGVNLTPLPLASPLMNKGGIKGGSESYIQISISNTGAGISADQQERIFDRFYQADNNYKKDGEGTGIGLALTKELVEVCGGEISVESKQIKQPPKSPFVKGDFRTTFKVIMPIARENFKEDEIVKKSETGYRKPEEEEQISISDENIISQTDLEKQSAVSGLRSPLLLIVEDNPDVTSYISSFMENDYRILTAENGKEGLKKTIDKYPDLIISDVMMPEMDGFEFCKKIKTDERISHIPVILLTAKADLDSKIEGLEFGCDDYVTKPFEAKELQIRAKNLIEQRKRLRDKFAQLNYLNPEDISVTSADETLLQRLLDVFENHIEEPDFSTEDFAHEVGMSRMNLNRKLQAVANQSTNEFIRSLRLKRAAQLLKKNAGTVSEVAYKVGFNNTSHFAKAFRKLYGITPSLFNGTEKK